MLPIPTLKRSRFLHILRRKNAYCLFHSLTTRKVYGNSILRRLFEAFGRYRKDTDVVEALSRHYPEETLIKAISDLRKKGLVVSDDDTDAATYLKYFHIGMDRPRITHLYLLPTSSCNLRCTYCFVVDCDRPPPAVNMSLGTARKSLEVFAGLADETDEVTMTLYGGEPLLNPDVTYASMRYARVLERKGVFRKPVKISMVTNGTLVDRRTVRALRETGTSVSVSIDGPRDIHDGARRDVGGGSTFDRALAGYRLLQSEGLAPGVSCTLSAASIGRIDRVVEFIVGDLKPAAVGFNMLMPRNPASNPGNYDYDYAARQVIGAFEVLRRHGIYEDRVMRRIKPFMKGSFHFKDCMGVGGQIVIGPDGGIGPCQAFLGTPDYFPLSVATLRPKLESLTSDHVYAHPLFDEWRHRFPLNMEACSQCFAIAACGGGCPYASMTVKGSIWEVDSGVCALAKRVMEWMIWDSYDQFTGRTKTGGTGANHPKHALRNMTNAS